MISNELREKITYERGRIDMFREIMSSTSAHSVYSEELKNAQNLIDELSQDYIVDSIIEHASYGTKYNCPVCNNYEFSEFKYCKNCGTHINFIEQEDCEVLPA